MSKYLNVRSWGLAAGAAALLSAQAVAAAPVAAGTPALDPLVSLSVLGSDQSRAAVCGAGSACALPGLDGATTMAATAAAVQGDYPRRGKTITWPLIIGGLVVIILIVIIASSGGGDADGDLTPISP